MYFKNTIAVTLIVCAFALSGCVSTSVIRTSVDSLAKEDASAKKSYFLLPGVKGVGVGDLQFQEFATYVDKALSEKGFVKAATIQDSAVAIFLTYAIGDPQTYYYSYSMPTWGKTGVSSAHTYGTVFSHDRTATYSGTTTYTPSYGVTGSKTHIASKTVYTRFLSLDAYDIATYVKENKMDQVWKINVLSTGDSDDLRRIIPYLVIAMQPYVGTNTGRKIAVEVPLNDPAVKLLRGSQASATK